MAGETSKNILPSFQEEVSEFLEKHKGKSIDEKDKAIMAKAAFDLDRAMPDPGLKPGEKAPDFTLTNAFGEEIKLSDQLKKGPVVLAFYRGAWCPFCNIELNVLQRSLTHFKEYDATLIAVTPQRPDKSREQLEKAEYSFEVLSDLDDSVMKSYNLYFEVPRELHELYKNRFGFDITDYNGKDRLGLPVPGTFVINRDGVIRASFAKTDYKKRMDPRDIIEALLVVE
ncbi:MAG: AhpC/TSA family protein, partial [Candidatus Scalindua sp.]|nr:AhpC/TSA family protein [Candidatus Scalindua sp.]